MKFVDRIEEQKRLHKCLHEAEGTSLSVIYGRRRLGKSTLIKRVFNDDDVYFMADNSESGQQRRLFAKLIAVKFEGFDKVEYPDWESLFLQVNYRTTDRFCICMDEFPLLVKSDRTLPSILQKLIDSKQLRYNIVLCGSSQQMMQGLVLDAAEPLYGRADNIIKLTPIHIRFLQEILQTNALQTVEEYAVWGGVPRYWELREKEQSMEDAVRYNIVNVNGTLYEEPTRLFMDDFQQTTLSSTLLSLIGNGVNKISEIAAKIGKPATELSRPLQKLISLGFVEREIPFGESPRSSKRGVYRIADPFMCFFYRYVVPNRSLIALGRVNVVEQLIARTMNEYVASRWEILCRNAVSGNVVDGTMWNVAGRWWGSVSKDKSVELDVVAESLDRKKILIGECKWTEPDYAERLFADLKARTEGCPLIKGKEVVYCLFLKYPPKDGMTSNVFLPENVVSDCF